MKVEFDTTDLDPLVRQIVAAVVEELRDDERHVSGRLAVKEAEAAALIGVDRHVLRDARLRGEINGSKIGKSIVYEVDELLAFLPNVPETTRLIFLESQILRNNHPAVLLANESSAGQLLAFPLPEGGQIDRWIQEQAAKKGGEISPRAANLLASLVGNDLQVLDSELEKLVAYKVFSSPIMR